MILYIYLRNVTGRYVGLGMFLGLKIPCSSGREGSSPFPSILYLNKLC